jgi:flagellar L-ring protein precursor FlgH
MRRRARAVVLPSTVAAACCLSATIARGQAAQQQQQQTVQSPRVPSGREPMQTPAQQPKAMTDNAPDIGLLFQSNDGSLYRASAAASLASHSAPDPNRGTFGQVSYMAQPAPEPKTIRKHDLITIVIHEESAFTSSESSELKREADIDAQLNAWARLNLDRLTLAAGKTGGSGGGAIPEVKMTGTRDFTGDGKVDRSDTLTARITGEVVDVKPNGTLVIQARKQIRTDEEEQQFVLSGTCRAEDVASDNTVLSTQIFDLQLQKNHKGTVREATRRTWLQKLLDVVSPF